MYIHMPFVVSLHDYQVLSHLIQQLWRQMCIVFVEYNSLPPPSLSWGTHSSQSHGPKSPKSLNLLQQNNSPWIHLKLSWPAAWTNRSSKHPKQLSWCLKSDHRESPTSAGAAKTRTTKVPHRNPSTFSCFGCFSTNNTIRKSLSKQCESINSIPWQSHSLFGHNQTGFR